MHGDKSLEEFAEQFSRQVRSGRHPTPEELDAEFPELTDDLKGFVNTLSILEEAGFQHRTRGASPAVADSSGRRWTRVGGFRLIREISRGGMGIVYEAEQEALQRRVAIKVLPSSPLLTETQLARFRREGTAIARLHHSHIVPVFGTGEQNGVHYCVMQYIEGCSLDRLIRTLRQRFGVDSDPDADDRPSAGRSSSADALASDEALSATGDSSECSPLHAMHVLLDEVVTVPLNPRMKGQQTGGPAGRRPAMPGVYWKKIARIGADMADALSHAHGRGILHRDVKPGNLLMDNSGHVWLADFGVAKLTDHDNLTESGGFIGTLRYSPPEQFDGQSDARSDIYSLGLTLYELCALQPAFSTNDRRELMRQIAEHTPQGLSKLMQGIPADLETVISKAMAPAPADRYQNAADLAADLNSFIADRPVTARRLTRLERSWRWCRRHRAETALIAVIAVLLMSFSATAFAAYVREARLRSESEQTARTAIAAINRVYDSHIPDWTTSSTVSAHGSISVTPATAQLLSGLLQFYDELARRDKQTAAVQDVFEVTAALRRVALIYHRLGMFAESKDAYGQALVRLSSLTQQSGGPRVQLEHARVNNEVGSVYWTDRQIAEAFESHQNALEILRHIEPVAERELRRDVLFERARTEYLLGRRGRGRQGGVPLRPVITRQQEQFDKHSRGERKRAESIYNAIRLLEELITLAPRAPAERHLLALCHCELSDGTFNNGDSADASFSRAIELLEQLVQEHPQHPAYRYSLCSALLRQTPAKDSAEPRLQIAVDRIARAILIAEELAQERPDEWIYAAAQVEAHLLMASLQGRRGMAAEAQESSVNAVVVGTRLAEKYPNCLSFQYWMGVALQSDGHILDDSAQPDRALLSYDQAIRIFNGVLQVKPEWDHVVLRDLRNTSSSRARSLRVLDRHSEAELAQHDAEEYAARLTQVLAATQQSR